MTNELLLAALVRDWAERVVPGDRRVAQRAADIAERCYAGGASVHEACREARTFVLSWSRHPACGAAYRDAQPPLAS